MADEGRDDTAPETDEARSLSEMKRRNVQQGKPLMEGVEEQRVAQLAGPQTNTEPKASVGRVVHYVERPTIGQPELVDRAADITEVDPKDGTRVGLFIKSPTTGAKFVTLAVGGCRYDAGRAEGTWHFPERV